MQTPAENVTICAPPAWANVRPYEADYKPAEVGHITVLLSDDQYRAETGEHYRRLVQRLETSRAVQEASQFRLDFDPKTQAVSIHSIAVIRAGERLEQAVPECLCFLQREEALEMFIIHGWVTVLLLLNDVRQGDIVDASFTITTRSQFMSEHFCLFHLVPTGNPIRELHLTVQFSKTRSMRWRSSSPGLAPETIDQPAELQWVWKQEKLAEVLFDTNLPTWFCASTWIQVTDCLSWSELVTACLNAWRLDDQASAVHPLAMAIKSETTMIEQRIQRALDFVQDNFRYFSTTTDLGGFVPSSASEVLARRYGDCKDLSCLLVALLRELDIAASPVLVNTALGERVRGLLPTPAAFNHVLVEFRIGNERFWVDPVRRLQGGDVKQRFVTEYGFGLVVEEDSKNDLVGSPEHKNDVSLQKVDELFLLNTAGPDSLLQVRITALGVEAEFLRNLFDREPERRIAQQRENYYAYLFPQVKRLGRMAFKDDRKKNEFVLAEMYEITGGLRSARDPRLCHFSYESHPIRRILRLPLHEDRKHPCSLTHPCRIEHKVEVEFSALKAQQLTSYAKEHPAFRLQREQRSNFGSHAVRFSFETMSDSILPEQFKSAREAIGEIWAQTAIRFVLPMGVRGRRPKNLTGVL